MIFRYMRERLGRICVSMSVKTVASLGELMIPYILQHMIDEVVPLGEAGLVVLWGLLMVAADLAVRQGNVFANRTAVAVARDCAEHIRQDLFVQTTRLSGEQIDRFGLPSLISRMTSDSYNVQTFIRAMQTLGVRAPILLVGGIAVTLTMDAALACTDLEQSYQLWQQAQWDGETGVTQEGDIPWVWLVNIDHLYWVRDGLQVAEQKIHPHGHGWSLVNNVDQWSWA